MPVLARRRRGLGPAVLIVTLLALASNAQASSLFRDRFDRLTWTSAGGAANQLAINYDAPIRCSVLGGGCDPSYAFKDPGESIFVDAAGCAPSGTVAAGTAVVCTVTDATPVSGVVASAGPGNDSLLHDVDECGTFACRFSADVAVPMVLAGGDGNDVLDGSSADDSLIGGDGADTLTGRSGSDTLTGGAGNDLLVPGLGGDNTIDGGPDGDTLSYDDGRTHGVTVTLGDGLAFNDGGQDDGVAGSREFAADIENVIGSGHDDVLVGDGAGNTLQGLGGDDVLRGGAGTDNLDGGAGGDTLDYSDHAGAVTATLDGSGAFKNGSAGENDRAVGFEAATGGAGADSLSSGYPSGNPVRLEGGLGGDTLTGGASDDSFVGGPGSDVVDGQGGSDTALYPGPDAIEVTLNDGSAKNDGGPDDGLPGARDRITTENVTGGSGPDVLVGDGGPNRIEGGDGDDTVQGGLGTDELSGGPGLDVLSYAERASSQPVDVSIDGVADDGAAGEDDILAPDFEIVAGGSGADRLAATGTAGVELRGNSGDDALFAPNGGGTISGGNGDDAITGGDGADTIDGGLGDDTIDGLGGTDQVSGGGGDDAIEARDGAVDAIDCGADTDTALADATDTRTGCELPAAPQAVGGTPTGGGTPSGGGAPAGGGAPSGGGAPGGGGASAGGAPTVTVQRDPERILVILGFSFRRSGAAFTTFQKLQVKAVPIGATVTAVCTAPKGKRCPAKSFSKRNAFGTVNLAKWTNKKLAAGTRLTVTVTKPGAFIGAVKTLTVAKRKPPAIGTRCLPPGAAKPVGC